MSSNYSTVIASAIKDYLTAEGWHFRFDEEEGKFEFSVRASGKMRSIQYRIRVRDEYYAIHGNAKVAYADTKDEKMMITMSEFINRANYGLTHGNFEFDHRDGEVRYKCTVACDDIVPSTKMIERSIYVIGSMFKRYGDGIFNIIYNDATAKDAIRQCEGDDGPSAMVEALEALAGSGAGEEELRNLIARLVASGDDAPDAQGQ